MIHELKSRTKELSKASSEDADFDFEIASSERRNLHSLAQGSEKAPERPQKGKCYIPDRRLNKDDNENQNASVTLRVILFKICSCF